MKNLSRLIDLALTEDAAHHDVTTKALVDRKDFSQAYIISREEAVICGNGIVKEIFKKFDPKATVVSYHKDGDRIKKNEPVIFFKGATSTILSCERVALNFLGHLSGIATLTNQFAAKAGKKAKILDTRKTTPGLRDLEKYAVKCGGGENHRRDLSAMVLIKDNHLAARNGDIKEAVAAARKTGKKIEIEVDTLNQLEDALRVKPDMILLDNMNPTQLKSAVQLRNKINRKVLLEASGGINLGNVSQIAKTGVDRISIGRITHSAPSIDFSLEFVI